MTEYLVVWRSKIRADSPQEAADKAMDDFMDRDTVTMSVQDDRDVGAMYVRVGLSGGGVQVFEVPIVTGERERYGHD